MKILKNHYKEVFNRSVPVDLSVLEGIRQLLLVEGYGATPSNKEIKLAISGMKKQQSSWSHRSHNGHDQASPP